MVYSVLVGNQCWQIIIKSSVAISSSLSSLPLVVICLCSNCSRTVVENTTYHVCTIDCTSHLDFPVVLSPLT